MSDIQNNITEEDEIFLGANREIPLEDILASMRHDFHVQGMSDKEIFERTTVVTDSVTGDKTTFKACIDKYGKNLALELLKAEEGKKELEPETVQQLKEIHSDERLALKDEKPKAAVKGKPKVKNDKVNKQFVPMPFDLLNNDNFKKQFKGLYLTYAFLRRYIIREQVDWDTSTLNLYEKHFLKGELASSWSIGNLAKHLGCSPTTIVTHIKKLKKSGCIKKISVPAKEAWDNQVHSIYVLGTHDGDNEKFFIDDVFGMPLVPEGQGVQ